MSVPNRHQVLVQLHSLALGGTQLNALDLAGAVAELGYRSVLCGPRDTVPMSGPSLLDVAAERGVRVQAHERSRTVRDGARALARRARSVEAGLVHLYGINADPRFAYWGPCRLGRRPFVHTVYEMAVDPDLYQHTSLVIGTGYLRDELVDRPGPTTLISPPVDTRRDAPDDVLGKAFRIGLGELGGRMLLVVVTRLDLAMKSYPVEVAIRAMAHLADTDSALVIVGDGAERDRLAALADAVNVAAGRRVVHFAGAMVDPRPAYAAADVCLGMGGSAARALAFGRPLVVQGEQGTAEPFEPDTASSLFRRSFWSDRVEEDAPRVLASLLRPLLADPERRARLGDFGRDFSVAHFGLEAMALRLAEVYETAHATYGSRSWWSDVRLEAPRLARSARRRLPSRRARR